jgi:endonuclease/exonuclease/phosphatase family metal-dependent hydrolase
MQAETLIEIVERKQRPKGRYIVLGDMNDTPTSKPLESVKELVNGLKTGRGARWDPELRRHTAAQQALDAPLQGVRPSAGVRTVRPGMA